MVKVMWRRHITSHSCTYLLVYRDLRVPVCIGIHPGCVVLLQVDTAVTAVVKGIRIIVGELRARAKFCTPPGIVNKEAAPVV
jgi:hypothetical protein